jgi:hypothetical protein
MSGVQLHSTVLSPSRSEQFTDDVFDDGGVAV